jgi:hypothetical protein
LFVKASDVVSSTWPIGRDVVVLYWRLTITITMKTNNV